MSFQPLHDRVLVKREEAVATTAGGIFLPGAQNEKSPYAVVVSVGPGRTLSDGSVHPCCVQPGDRVLVAKHAGSDVKLDGVEHLLLREDEILGVFSE